jgi:hypothetical protein
VRTYILKHVPSRLLASLKLGLKIWLSGRPEDLPGCDLSTSFVGVDVVCLYVDRYQRKYHRNLRFGPLFSEGFRFAL